MLSLLVALFPLACLPSVAMRRSDAVYESKLAAVKAEHGEVVAQADDAKRAQRFHALQRQRKQRTDQLSVTQKQVWLFPLSSVHSGWL